MTALAPTLQAFFVSRLGRQRDASAHTVASYRHAFRMLLAYAEVHTGKKPSQLDVRDLDATLVSGFLDHLEEDRGSSVASRNTRLAALHSFFRFASYRHPEHVETIQQGAGHPPQEDRQQPPVLPHQHRDGRPRCRPRPLYMVWSPRPRAARRGAADRSSTLGAHWLRCRDVELGAAAHVKCLGKGRKRRDTPLDKLTVVLLRSWLRERRGEPDDALFPSRHGGRLSPDAVQRLVAKHVTTAMAWGRHDG